MCQISSLIQDYVYALLDEKENTELIMLKGGPLLQEIISNMQAAVDGKSSNLYYVFSGHDSTIQAILLTLGAKLKVLPNRQPDFAATLVFELWKMDDGSFQVQLAYSDNAYAPFRVVTQDVEGCPVNNICPFEVFLNRSQPYMPTDIDKQCANIFG